MAMNTVSREFLSRIKDTVARTSALGRVSDWLEKNTKINGQKFSFKGHEFQREIIDCKHPNVATIKPSQCGLSEMSARLALGFLAVQGNVVSIYTLPTVNEALRFAKSRIDPIIRDSEYLTGIMSAGNDSSSFKQIGSSQLFMAGTFGKALISIPTDLLIVDEVDFSNPEVLVTAESRLTHSKLKDEDLNIRGVRRKLSTPTVTGVGISEMFENSDKRYRLVKCRTCLEYSIPSFLDNVVVQGYDRSMHDLTYSDVQDLELRGLLNTAKLLCPYCHNVIEQRNLQPDYREWVAEHPTVTHIVGFQVSPFDLPDYHSAESILRKRLEFKEEEGHFRNFVLGLPHDSSSNSVSKGAVKKNKVLNFEQSGSGCIAGLDVGRVSWLTIGRVVNGKLHVIWAESIRVNYENADNLFDTVKTRLKEFGVVRAVMDSQPFFDTILRIQGQFPEGVVLPCMYTLRDTKLPAYVINDRDWTVAANRTKVLDIIVKKINSDNVKFANFPEIDIVEQHLQGMKRVERTDDEGTIAAQWVKTGPDHYFHSLSYLNMCSEMVQTGEFIAFSPKISIKQAIVGRNYREKV